MTKILDLDPALLGLEEDEAWLGDGTWTSNGVASGSTVGGHPALHLHNNLEPGNGFPAELVASLDSPSEWAVHLVAALDVPGDAPALVFEGGAVLIAGSGGKWVVPPAETPAVGAAVSVVTLTCSGGTVNLYLNGAFVGSSTLGTAGTSVTVASYAPSWHLLRFQMFDEIPSSLAADILGLVSTYVGGSQLAAEGVYEIDGTATLRVFDDEDDDPWTEPDVPEPTPGGSVEPPEPPEAQLPPAGVPDPVIRRATEFMLEPPELSAQGRPVDWEPVASEVTDWGRLQIVVEGTDITYLGGAPTPFPTIIEVEPFGWASASIRLPQLTTFHELGQGSLSWCRQGANVRIRVKKIAGGYVDLFRGFVESPIVSEPGDGVRLECTGLLFQADKTIRTPSFSTRPRDAGAVIADLLNGVPGRRYAKMGAKTTGIRTSVAGAWEPVLTGAVQQMLATMVDRQGRQWTLMPDGREPVLRRKNLTDLDWSVRNGQRGIAVDLEREMKPNVIYGEGVRPDGGRWRNAKYPNWRPDDTPAWPMGPSQSFHVGTTDADTSSGSGVSDWQRKAGQPVTGVYSSADREACRDLQRDAGIQVDGAVGPQTWAATFGTGANTGTLDGAFIAPLVAASAVKPRLYGPDGDDLGENPDYDPDVIRVEEVVAFGHGVTKAEARRSVRRSMSRASFMSGYAYHGTVRFEMDPTEGHRLEVVRAGTNGVIEGVHGEAVWVHVSRVTITQGGTGPIVVTATVDTEARDYPTLAAIRDRERNAIDPAKAFIKRRSRDDQLSNRAIFDAESPAGIVPRHALFPNLWTVLRIPFGDYGEIVRTEFRTSNNASPFALAVFSKAVTASDLMWAVGNPLTAETNPWSDAADELESLGLLMAWGWAKQPAGYYPRTYSTPDAEGGAPVTGKLLDEASWRFASEQPPWLWVATIASQGCHVEGRFYPGADL